MSDYQTILYEKQRRGVLITLNRPRALNAMNEELMNDLDDALAEAETDPEIRAVVITGAGGVFSAGEDISGPDSETAWPYGIPTGTSLNATYNKFRDTDRKDILGRQLYRWQYPKPIIGAVSGWCLGAASWRDKIAWSSCIFLRHVSTRYPEAPYFFALGPNGSGWKGPSRSCKNAARPPFFFASSNRLLNSSRLVRRAMAANSEFSVQALRRPIISNPIVEICRLIFTVSGGTSAMRSTNLKQVSSSSFLGTTWFTRPMRRASCAST